MGGAARGGAAAGGEWWGGVGGGFTARGKAKLENCPKGKLSQPAPTGRDWRVGMEGEVAEGSPPGGS